MASYRGCLGTVKVTDTAIAEIRSWNFDQTVEIIDASAMGSCDKVKKAGMKDATGSVTCFWDDADAAQALIVVEAEVELKLYPRGSAITGSKFVTLTAIISSVGESASYDGLVEMTFNFEATGPVVWAAVT